ncbi:MAG: phosphotransferase [Eubacterium sp.]|nr:phosphotransferase [Eubacterium sp.]
MENGIIIKLEGRITVENAGEVETRIHEAIGAATGTSAAGAQAVAGTSVADTQAVAGTSAAGAPGDDTAAAEPPVIDASALDYISSAGLRVLMKLRKQYNKPLIINNVSSDVYEIFETTGFTNLFDVRRKLREISLDGCEIIGTGFDGTVYRLDDETIVKMYASADALDKIRHEKEMAKAAFVKGIPTAISYGIVQCDGLYGSTFEIINSKTYNDMIRNEPERADEIIENYVRFLKSVHETEMDPGTIPDKKEAYIGYLDLIRDFIPADKLAFLSDELKNVPDSLQLVHGDMQMKNVMVMDGEPILIDMESIGTGVPEFDIGALYATYYLFEEDDPGNAMSFLGIPTEMTTHIWEGIEGRYYAGLDEATRAERLRRAKALAYILFLYYMTFMPDDELKETRIRRTCEHIDELRSEG